MTDAAQPGDVDGDSRLDDLVARCLAAADEHGSAGIERCLADDPELADDARRRLRLLHDAGLVPDLAEAGSAPGDPPRQLGEFEILQRLGGGGMGVVYRARQRGLQRDVALKLVRPDMLGFGNARLRFAREAEAVARLAHPGIVPVHTVGEDGGIPYLAMELVHGVTLGEVLTALAERAPGRLSGRDLGEVVARLCTRRDAESAASPGDGSRAPTGSTTVRERLFGGSWCDAVWRIGIQVAEALCHAHERGVLHRDVKPSNLMVTPTGRVLLLDFGLARSEGDPRITGPGAELGSLHYTPPEALRGQQPDGHTRGDVYSLAVTLFELLALRAPFDAPSSEDVRARVLHGEAPRLRDVNPSVTQDGATVIAKAMDLDPAQRYVDMAAFLADLQNLLARRPVEARPASSWLRTRRWTQRHPARAVGVVLGSLLVLGLPLTWGLVQDRAARRIAGHLADEQAARSAEASARARADAALAAERQALADAASALQAEREARGVADAERGRSERSVERARDAITVLLAELAREEFGGTAGAETGRRRMLEQALGFLQGFLVDHGDDPALARDLVLVARQLAETQTLLGDTQGAAVTLADALRRADALVALHDDDTTRLLATGLAAELAVLHRELGQIDDAAARLDVALLQLDAVAPDAPGARPTRIDMLIERGRLERMRGDPNAAVEDTLQAVGLATTWLEQEPDDRDALHAATVALAYLGDCLVDLGELRQAREVYERALAQARRYAAGSREPADIQVVVRQLGSLGELLLDFDDTAAARRDLEEALELARGLVAGSPQVERYVDMLAHAHGALANVARREQRWDDAREHIEASIELMQGLVDQQPQLARLRQSLSAELHNLASLEFELQRWDAALSSYERARAEALVGLTNASGLVILEDTLWLHVWMLSRTHLARGDHARAAEEAEASLHAGAPTAKSLRLAAGLFARCIGLGGGAELDAAYRARGLDCFEQAVDMGWSDIHNVSTADDMTNLRGHPRFEATLARMEAASP